MTRASLKVSQLNIEFQRKMHTPNDNLAYLKVSHVCQFKKCKYQNVLNNTRSLLSEQPTIVL